MRTGHAFGLHLLERKYSFHLGQYMRVRDLFLLDQYMRVRDLFLLDQYMREHDPALLG